MKTFLTILAAVAITLFVTNMANNTGDKDSLITASNAHQTAFNRIMKTGTIRCGCAPWYPNLIIDPNTRAMSGISYDVTTEIGRRLGVKVEWTQEAGFASAEQDLMLGKYDMLCADVCYEARRNKGAYFSRPFRQDPIYMTARADDARFSGGYAAANAPDIKVAVLSNTILDTYANEYVPQAKKLYVNELRAEADAVTTLATRKADVSFNNLISVDRYNKNNDVKIQAIRPAVDMCNGSFMIPLGDDRLKHIIDGAINEMIAADMMPAIYKRYLPDSPDYWRVPEQVELRGKDK